MSTKKDGLTKDKVFRTLQKYPGMAADVMATMLWADIEADRQAVREEIFRAHHQWHP